MKVRPGAVLLELLTSTVMLGFLSAACAALLRADAMVVMQVQEQSADDEAMRIASIVTGEETMNSTSADVRAVSRDSLALRAFRGYGIVCALAGGRTIIRYRGLRAPDQDKDSLLVVGSERTTDFRTATPPRNSCAGSREDIVAATTTRPLSIGNIVLFFESGAYYLSNNAFRYRRGGEGRQPLTDDRIADQNAAFESQPRGLRVRVSTFSGTGISTFVHLRNESQ